MKKLIIVLICLMPLQILFAQDKMEVNLESKVFVSSAGSIEPHYQFSNQWGIISPFEQSQILFLGGLKYQIFDRDKIKLNVGVSGVLKNEWDDSFLHEAFLSGKAFNLIDFNIGKETYTPLIYKDELTIGGFLMNSNARPLPRITMGIYDYLPLGFTKNWI